MPQFLSRPLEWFRARPRTQQVLIGVAVLFVLAVASPVVAALAGLIFVAALIALAAQLIRRRPARPWAIVAGGALVVALAFWGLSSALLGPDAEDQPRVEQAEKPEVEEDPEPPEELAPEEEPAPEPQEEQAPSVPDYTVRQADWRELGDGTIVLDLLITDTEAKTEAEFRAIGQKMKEEYRYEGDALFVETLNRPDVDMWVLIEDRAKETYEEVVETPEYRDGVAIYFR